MAYREIRRNNKLICRFDPEHDLIEIVVRGQRIVIALVEYRPLSQRCKVESAEPVCYTKP
jgi:hypothetical protein